MSEDRKLDAETDLEKHTYSSNPSEMYTMSSLEDRVYRIALEMMEKHYVFNTKSLYSLCTRFIKDEDKSSINNAISSLLSKKILIEGTTLSRMDLMENPNRRTIYSIIKSKPGINVGLLQNMVGLHTSTVLWHIQMLEKFQFIRTEKILNKMVCFDYIHERKHDLMYVTLHKKRMVKIISIVHRYKEINMTDLQEQMELNRSSFMRKIGELLNIKVLIRDANNTGENSLEINDEIFPHIKIFLEE
ncbi:MAG: winged helix-turn-helix transcriptional regulator [Candidatus Hodarchaeota archaeon]